MEADAVPEEPDVDVVLVALSRVVVALVPPTWRNDRESSDVTARTSWEVDVEIVFIIREIPPSSIGLGGATGRAVCVMCGVPKSPLRSSAGGSCGSWFVESIEASRTWRSGTGESVK